MTMYRQVKMFTLEFESSESVFFFFDFFPVEIKFSIFPNYISFILDICLYPYTLFVYLSGSKVKMLNWHTLCHTSGDYNSTKDLVRTRRFAGNNPLIQKYQDKKEKEKQNMPKN